MDIFLGLNIIGLRQHGLHFFSLFLPPGAPLALAPLLVPIELISYVFRVVALSVRLFANMMAGHTLLKILATFAWKMLSIGGIFLIIQLFPLAVIIAITGLELVGTVSSLTLTDMNGKVVKVLDTKATKFSMGAIKQGVYFLNIISGNKQEVLKIVKE